MDSRTARWMLVLLLDDLDLSALHEREKSRALRSGPLNRPLFMQKNLLSWECPEMLRNRALAGRPDGYWPKGMDLAAQARAVSDFERGIYPIWKGIEERDVEIESKLTMEELHRPGQTMAETRTTHKQDIAIRNSNIRPNMEEPSREDAMQIRKRAAAQEKFSEWKD